jgi:hypothetical protein
MAPERPLHQWNMRCASEALADRSVLAPAPALIALYFTEARIEGGRMRIHNLYVDAKGETHFRDIEVKWVEEREFSKYSARLPATGIIFRETSGDYDLDWHPAPRCQYIINLDGGVQITASDGESRIIGAGEVVLVEDTTGKGHLSKSVAGKMRRSVFVPIE